MFKAYIYTVHFALPLFLEGSETIVGIRIENLFGKRAFITRIMNHNAKNFFSFFFFLNDFFFYEMHRDV